MCALGSWYGWGQARLGRIDRDRDTGKDEDRGGVGERRGNGEGRTREANEKGGDTSLRRADPMGRRCS